MTASANSQRERVFLVIAAVAAGATGLIWLQSGPPSLLLLMRWLVLATLVAYACFRRSLTAWIFVAMLLGAEIGHDLPSVALHLRVLAMIFLRLIKTIIAPLLFRNAGGGHRGTLKPAAGRTAWTAVDHLLRTGHDRRDTSWARALSTSRRRAWACNCRLHRPPTTCPSGKLSAEETILHVFPENIAKSVADNAVLQVVVFSLIFAVALAMVGEQKRAVMLGFCESLAETMFKFTNIVMYMAPIGVGAAVAYTVAHTGFGIIVSLLKLVLTLYAALLVFIFGVLLPIALAFRVPLRRFIKAVIEPVSIAFATSSSEAALPRAMEAMEGLGVPRQIVAFVIPTGYSFNLDGSSLYLSVAAIFVAQVAGIHLSLGQQLVLMFTLMLTSKGVAGVSRAALVILLATASSAGLPTEPVFLLLGVDQLLDMGRTAVNVLGNCLATVVIARWEGEFDDNHVADAELAALRQ